MMPFRMTKYIPVEPTDMQAYFLFLDKFEVFYGGAAGGGKSAELLMAALQYVDIEGYNALILRRRNMDLIAPGGLIELAEQWLSHTDAQWHERFLTWSFPSGAKLRFGFMENEKGQLRYKKHKYQFVGFDNVEEFSESMYRCMFSQLEKLKGINLPLRMRSAGNLEAVGSEWVRQRMIVEGKERNILFVPAASEDMHKMLPGSNGKDVITNDVK